MKACLLAAGEGKRLAPLTETRPKHMIPIAGKPLLQYTLEILRENGITEIQLIVGYLKEKIQEYFGDGSKFSLKITYTEQKEFLGTGHATALAEKFSEGEPFLLIYADLFFDPQIITKSIETFNAGGIDATIAAFRVPDPQKFGIIKTSPSGLMEQIIEKPPDDRYGTLANAGVYLFTPPIFDGIRATEKSPRGEYELTESMQRCIDKGYKIKVIDVSGLYWSDVGHAWQILSANHHMMEKMTEGNWWRDEKYCLQHNIHIDPNVTIKGVVKIGDNTQIKAGTYIEGPVIIGEQCVIGPNAYLRPYSAIGNYCKIGNSSEVKASILMDYSALPHLSYAGDSILGEHVNFGCGTVTANVRLDKQQITMRIKGQKVATGCAKLGAVIGDFASLGVQVSIMPGKTIGSYAQVGSNVVVSEDIPASTRVYTKNELISKKL
jgi:bifunctional UDP-N-acetylglucosamine pyrophosphorylase/glucosamine-1-phosphate N-acetyltransferase